MEETAAVEPVRKGQIILAEVHSWDDKDIFLTINHKQTGSCPRKEFVELPDPGSTIPVMVENVPVEGIIALSRKSALLAQSKQALVEAYEAGSQLTGKVQRHFRNGLIIDFGGLHLHMPEGEIDLRPRYRPAVGTEIDFKVLSLKGRSASVSRRQILLERNDALWNEFSAVHKEGDEIEAEVQRLVTFGVFLKLPFELEGLLHQTDISWRKFAPFKDRFSPGQKVTVKILKLDKENNRISLGLRQMMQDPWEWARDNIKEGADVEGRVISTTDYGAFLEIREGLDGMIHSSEMSWARRPLPPQHYLQVGQTTMARVISIDFDKKRIALSLREMKADPWKDLARRLKKGDVLEGTVQRISKLGASVEIEPDVEGLIYYNDYSWDEKPDRSLLKLGEKVKCKLLECKPEERKLTLGLKQLQPGPHEMFRRKVRNGQAVECTIKAINDKGIEVSITQDNLSGWIPRKNIPVTEEVRLQEKYQVGMPLKASLSGVNVEERRITLSIRDFEKQKDREILRQYIKKDESPSTASLGSLLKKKL
ncbi:MAG: S1 RNA-binding domain-containing protein [Spirochaetales bacterium]|nr:S1 RNA-binding domain-containing protein [Spirochaetales bacterium]